MPRGFAERCNSKIREGYSGQCLCQDDPWPEEYYCRGKGGAGQIAAGSSQIASTSEQASRNNEAAATAIEETTATMHEMSANIQNVAKNSQSQSSSVTETSSSIEQMVTSIQRIASTGKLLVDLSQKTKKAVELGFEAVSKSIKGTDEINSTISSALQIPSLPSARGQRI